MLTVPEVAARVGRDPETVRRWIRSGRLPAHKVGTQHVVEEADLATFDVVSLPLPEFLARSASGEPLPDVVAAVRRSRQGH